MRQLFLCFAVLSVLCGLVGVSSQQSEFAKRVTELSEKLAFATKGQILAVEINRLLFDSRNRHHC